MRTYDDTMFIDTFEHEYTWLNGFLRNVQRFSARPAVIDPDTGRNWSYAALNAEANRLADALARAGVGKDDVVLGALRNSPEFAFCYCGIRKIGAIFLAANFNLAPGELALLIAHNRPKAVLYSADAAGMVARAQEMCTAGGAPGGAPAHTPTTFIMADNIEGAPLPAGHTAYGDFVRGAAETEPARTFRPHIYDEVLRLCTSGTTALPKCVPVNDINEVLSAHDVIMHYPMDYHDITLNMTPWFHRGGCHSGGVGPTFYAGGAVVVMRNFRPQTALDWVGAHKITFLMGAPSNLELLSLMQEKRARDLSSLKGIVTMGAPLSRADCVRYMRTLTPNIFNGYGTTETFWNSFLRPFDLPDGAGSVGAPCTDDEVRVVRLPADGGTRTAPDDLVPKDGLTEGEIIIRAPEKSTYTYIGDEAAAREKFHQGWMYTGDTGTWDKNLVVTVHGRRDDMMVVSGENIYPAQIEAALCECPKVRDAIVTSVPDKVRGQAVAAYVVPADATLTVQELAAFCAGHTMLPRYKRPRYFALVDTIPATATGKKKHFEMKARAPADLERGILRRP